MNRVVLTVALLALLSGCSQKAADTAEETAATPVEVAKVERKSMASLVEAQAVLYPLRQASIMPKISAPVQKFLVQRGDHVKAGQLLALLESRDLSAAALESRELYRQSQATFENTKAATLPDDLTKARSDVQSATEAMDAARQVYESRVKLYKEGALAEKLVEDAKVALVQAQSTLETARQHLKSLESVGQAAQLQAGQAQVDAAKAHYESAAAQLSYTEVRSPIDGVIADRPLNVGEMASSGSALLSIVNIARVVARANVPIDVASHVRVGQKATISSGKESLDGKVSVVSPAVDPNTTTIQVWVEAPNPEEKIKLGATVHISIEAGEIQDAVVVPAAALLPLSEGGEKVMIAGADSLAHEQPVKVGIRTAQEAQILSGLKGGEQVIVSGALGLDDKAKIKIGAGEKESGEKEAK